MGSLSGYSVPIFATNHVASINTETAQDLQRPQKFEKSSVEALRPVEEAASLLVSEVSLQGKSSSGV
ncbi:hypothetical protein BaRGS_00022469, partial [Batillaria attramentaria]